MIELTVYDDDGEVYVIFELQEWNFDDDCLMHEITFATNHNYIITVRTKED